MINASLKNIHYFSITFGQIAYICFINNQPQFFRHTPFSSAYYIFDFLQPSTVFPLVVQLSSCVWLFETPRTAACQASLSPTIPWSLPNFMSIELVMPPNHLILCHPLLLPSVFPSIRGSSSELAVHIRWPKCWSFSFSKLSHLLWREKGGPET